MEDGLSSFWGPVTSTDWCEKNYAHSSYVAEFFNSVSNIPCILLALFGLVNAVSQHFEKRFSVLHLSNMTLAIGTTSRHITASQGGETPMVWEMLLYIYILHSSDWHYRSTMPTFLFIYGTGFAVLHSLVCFGVGFKVHYAILCLLCIPRMYKYYIYTEEKSAKYLAKLYVAMIFLASVCWLLDKLLCRKVSRWYINPQGHALWHVLMGFNSFCEHFLDVLSGQATGVESEGHTLHGSAPLREDPEDKNTMTEGPTAASGGSQTVLTSR